MGESLGMRVKWRKKWPRGGGNEGETGIMSGFVGAVL